MRSVSLRLAIDFFHPHQHRNARRQRCCCCCCCCVELVSGRSKRKSHTHTTANHLHGQMHTLQKSRYILMVRGKETYTARAMAIVLKTSPCALNCAPHANAIPYYVGGSVYGVMCVCVIVCMCKVQSLRSINIIE